MRGRWVAVIAGFVGLAAGGGIGVASAGPLAPTSTVTTTETDTTTSFVDGPTVTVTTGATTVTNTVTTTATVTIPPTPPGTTTTDCNGADPCPPRGPSGKDGTYNCADFDTQQQAQDYFDQVGNIDGLDANGDGVPCQNLP
jgi:hypothetical protein